MEEGPFHAGDAICSMILPQLSPGLALLLHETARALTHGVLLHVGMATACSLVAHSSSSHIVGNGRHHRLQQHVQGAPELMKQ